MMTLLWLNGSNLDIALGSFKETESLMGHHYPLTDTYRVKNKLEDHIY